MPIAVLLAAALVTLVFLTRNTKGAAADPGQYRTGSPEPRAGQVPAEIQRGVFESAETNLEPLVRYLLAGERDGFRQVKLLHDWIAANIAYDVEAYFSGQDSDSSAAGTLQRRRGVCHGYAALLEEMCRLAGIPCRTISGYGRGYAFDSAREQNLNEVNHAWNAVHVAGRWHLVDATWDAGHVDGRVYRKSYRTTYLFMPPEHFIYTHWPTEARWQLLAAPLTAEQFDQLPYLRGPFFDFGLRLESNLARVTRVGAVTRFTLRLPLETELLASLSGAGGVELPDRTIVQHEDQQGHVLVAFPGPGRYRVELYGRQRGADGVMKLAADLDFEATAGTSKVFPKLYPSFGTMRGYLYSPLSVPLAGGEQVTFRVRLHGAHDVKLAIGSKPWIPLRVHPDNPDVYELTTTVPPQASVQVNAKHSPDDETHTTVIDFSAGDQ